YSFAALPPPDAATAEPSLAGYVRPSGWGYLRPGVASKAESDWVAVLGAALAKLGEVPGMLLDLRGLGRTAPDPWESAMWPAAFVFFLDAGLPLPGTADRVHTGWSAGTLDTYQETWELTRGTHIQPIRAPGWGLTMQHPRLDFAALPCFTGPLAILVDDDAL